MSGLILTPGFETNNQTTDHYSVFVANLSSENIPVHLSDEECTLYSSSAVRGALFFQHHMMQYNNRGDIVARPRDEIRSIIQTIQSCNAHRSAQGIPILECAFDAEPAPVQTRRYYHNPNGWPSDEMQQANKIIDMMQTGQMKDFLADEVADKGYLPQLPSQRLQGSIATDDLKSAKLLTHGIGQITGRALGGLGIDTLYAPVMDLGAVAFHERCYGSNPDVAIDLAELWALGALSQPGIHRICLKHAPGHGVKIESSHNTHDTHNSVCRSHASQTTIKHHLHVFAEVIRRLRQHGVSAEAVSVMTNHIVYTNLDPYASVSLSKKAMYFIQEHMPDSVHYIADCVNMASFGTDNGDFLTNLKCANELHSGGVIATTHYVKKASRLTMMNSIKTRMPQHQLASTQK
jgi:hypothetical protein